jgi:short-subunit dehydrogenase
MPAAARPLAVVPGASTGIGYELVRFCAENGFDLVVAADEAEIYKAAKDFEALVINADLATLEGVDALYAKIGGRPVDALLANAGRGLGKGFLDQDFDDVLRVVNTNITGTIYLNPEGRPRHACPQGGPHSDYRLDRRIHSGHLPGGLQRDQGLSRLLLLCPARGGQGQVLP